MWVSNFLVKDVPRTQARTMQWWGTHAQLETEGETLCSSSGLFQWRFSAITILGHNTPRSLGTCTCNPPDSHGSLLLYRGFIILSTSLILGLGTKPQLTSHAPHFQKVTRKTDSLCSHLNNLICFLLYKLFKLYVYYIFNQLSFSGKLWYGYLKHIKDYWTARMRKIIKIKGI